MPAAEPSPKSLREVSSTVYPKLERVPGIQNWVDKVGGLPEYIERIAKHIHYEHGKDISTAIAMAVNTVKKWTTGFNNNGGKLTQATVAKAKAALAQWEAKKAASHVTEAKTDALLTDVQVAAMAGAFLHRLSVAEGIQRTLKGKRTTGKSGALASAQNLLEGRDTRMVLGRGTVERGELARVQSALGAEVAELKDTLALLRVSEALAAAESPVVRNAQAAAAKGRNGQPVSFDSELHPRASGGPAGGQFIKKGSSGPAVKGIQRKLGVTVDGKFGKETATAVKAYQEDHNLTSDGVVGAQTAASLRGAEAMPGPMLGHHPGLLRKLQTSPADKLYSKANLAAEDAAEKTRDKAKKARKEAKSKASSSSSTKSSSQPTTGPGSVLGPGSTLPTTVVDLIQRKLGISTTGKYDEATKKRIEAFQKKNGLMVDGIVGAQTLAALQGDKTPPSPGAFSQSDWEWLTSHQSGGAREKRRQTQKAKTAERETAREKREEAQLKEAAPAPQKGKKPPPAAQDDHHRSYGAGMAGAPDEATAHLQNRLTGLGYDSGPTDGRFGEKTEGAVKSFQEDHGLDNDGKVGGHTKVALRGADPSEVGAKRKAPKSMEPEVPTSGDPQTQMGSSEETAMEDEGAEAEGASAGDTGSGDNKDDPEKGEDGETTTPAPKLAGAALTKGAGIEKPDPAVKAMQKAVGAKKDGWFGPATEKKLKSTQRKYGLKADGVVDPTTGRLLDRLNATSEDNMKKGDEADLEEAILERMEAAAAGDGPRFIRARAREGLYRQRLAEGRGIASDLERDFYRLSDGTFAPKGLGRILRPGETITLPHQSGSGSVKAKIEAGEKGKGLARITTGPDKGRLIGVRTAAPESLESHAFPKALPSRPAELPNMKRNAGWGEKDKYDGLNAEAKAQSSLDQMNHHMAAGNEQAVQDHVDDAKGEADFNGGNAGKRYEELERNGNHFLEHGEVMPSAGDVANKIDNWEGQGSHELPDGTTVSSAGFNELSGPGDHGYTVEKPDGSTQTFSGMDAAARASVSEAPGEKPKHTRPAPPGQKAPAESGAEPAEAVEMDKQFDEAMADPQRAPIDFSSLSDGDLNKAMDEATSHMSGVPMTARDRSVFRGVTQERARRAKREARESKSPSLREKAASVVQQLTGKRPAGMPQPQHAPPEGFAPNEKGTAIKDMAPGDSFYIGKYDTPFTLHKSVGPEFSVAKPTDGGKAQPFHKEMVPTFLGPHDPNYPANGKGGFTAPAAPAATNDTDLFNALQNSIAGGNADHGEGATVASSKSSPARSAKGNLRNFKAMSDNKLTSLATAMKAHPEDEEAIKAITTELKSRAGTSAPKPAFTPATVKKVDAKTMGAIDNALGKMEPGHHIELPNGTTVSREENAQGDYIVGGVKVDGGWHKAGIVAFKAEGGSGDGKATPSKTPSKKAAPDGGSSKKLQSAWGAYDKKKAEFDALPKDATKEERAKKASQVRAAKFRIKRVGGDPSKRPDDVGAPGKGAPAAKAKPAEKAAPKKPAEPTLAEKMEMTQGAEEIPLKEDEVGDGKSKDEALAAAQDAQEQANAVESPSPEQVNAGETALTLGAGWDWQKVGEALDKLEQQGLKFDRANEAPATLAAVIKAAGLDPHDMKTQGTV